jgi:hypothetical protein
VSVLNDPAWLAKAFDEYHAYFTRLAVQGHAVLGRGVLIVRVDGDNATHEYIAQERLVGDSAHAVGIRERVAAYDPEREVVIAFVDQRDHSITRIGITPIGMRERK